MRHTSKEEYLKFLDESTNKDLLNSLTLNHTPFEELTFLDRSSHNTGTVSVPNIRLPEKLLNAFKKADEIFSRLESK
ncbi:hypothetical protein ACOTWV_08820 [Aliarcobacter butzleri]|uniref:hypothetical protein n=1 Tax=Aliarcobacter butzleri TaxID=28197 RepID=UPI003AF50A80